MCEEMKEKMTTDKKFRFNVNGFSFECLRKFSNVLKMSITYRKLLLECICLETLTS